MAGAERKGQELGCGKWMLACAAGKVTARQNTKGPLPGASEKNAHPSRSLARQRPPGPPTTNVGHVFQSTAVQR